MKMLDSPQRPLYKTSRMPSLGAEEHFADSLACPQSRRQTRVRIADYVRQLAGTGTYILICALAGPAFWLLRRLPRGCVSEERGQVLLHHLFRIFLGALRVLGCVRIDAEGLDAVKNLRGTVVAANHPGLIDAFLVASLLPRVACVMKADLLANPTLREGALLAGYVTNDSGPGMVRQGIGKIRNGGNLLIFPEGTRTRSQAVNRFKSGFAVIAVTTGAPVQTVLIETHGRHLSKGTSLLAPARLPLRFKIRPGGLFVPETGESAREFAARLELWFRARLVNTGDGIRAKNPPEI